MCLYVGFIIFILSKVILKSKVKSAYKILVFGITHLIAIVLTRMRSPIGLLLLRTVGIKSPRLEQTWSRQPDVLKIWSWEKVNTVVELIVKIVHLKNEVIIIIQTVKMWWKNLVFFKFGAIVFHESYFKTTMSG